MEILLQGIPKLRYSVHRKFFDLPCRRWPFHRAKLISTKLNMYLSEYRGDVGEAPLIFTPHNASH